MDALLQQYQLSDDEGDDHNDNGLEYNRVDSVAKKQRIEEQQKQSSSTTTTTTTINIHTIPNHSNSNNNNNNTPPLSSSLSSSSNSPQTSIPLPLLSHTTPSTPTPTSISTTQSPSNKNNNNNNNNNEQNKIKIPIRGKYVSKREREALSSQSNTTSIINAPITTSYPITDTPPYLNTLINDIEKLQSLPNTTKKHRHTLHGHSKGVNCVQWSPNGGLLASGSMDGTVRVWDIFREDGACVKLFNAEKYEPGAVRDVKWSHDSLSLLCGGYDKIVQLWDVETGKLAQKFEHDEWVTSLAFHPKHPNLFITGGYHSSISCWDTRTNMVISNFEGMIGQVQCVEFFLDGNLFMASSDVTKRNSIDKAIMVWDFETGVVQSNQVYHEAYTIPSLKAHPNGKHFVAQSNADYIAIFSTESPFKMNKFKRFEGHQVAGYHIGCDFNKDGSILATGSSDGQFYLYDWSSSKIVQKKIAHPTGEVCIDVSFHPIITSMIATCSWDKTVCVFE